MTNPKHTDTSRSGDLVERLRERKITADTYPWLRPDALCVEAADLIGTQAREIERLREALTTISHEGGQAEARFARAALAGDSHD